MREHPVPQNVTSYEFHLISNMTIKQFFELAAGVIAGLLVYSTNLLVIVKWPLILFFVLLGIITAFIPFEGRPLDRWFINFIRAIYRPTEFYWRKSGKVPDYLLFSSKSQVQQEEELNLTLLKNQRIAEYIKTLPGQQPATYNLDAEEIRVSEVLSLFDQVQVSSTQVIPTPLRPPVTLETRGLQPLDKLLETNQASTEDVSSMVTAMSIPQTKPLEQEHTDADEEADAQNDPTETQSFEVFSSTTAEHQAPEETVEVQTSLDLPFPKRPTIPNLIVGMVFDQYNKIVENAIVEIQDEQGMPLRAVKTNSIGQFFISTPLQNGKYIVKVDKDNIDFIPQQLTLQNEIIDPLLIKAELST